MPSLQEIATPGYDPYANTAGDVGWFGGDIVKGIGKAAKSVAKTASNIGKNPIVKGIVGAARTALKNTGPIGMVANGAISAMDAGFSGKNVAEIALAAAQGAAPSGIDTALNAGIALARGDNVLSTAVKAGADSFAPGSGERFAYSVAVDALKKGGTKVDLGNARRALASEGQRRAFDAAVGVVSLAAKKAVVKKGLLGAMQNRIAANRAPALAARAPLARKVVKKVVKKIPAKPQGLRALSSGRPTARPAPTITPRGNVATSNRPVLNVKSHKISPNRLVKWRRVSPKAAKFILRHVPLANRLALVGRDTGALAGGLVAANMPTIRSGNTGAPVSTLQATLNAKRGAGLVVDGKFGPLTLTAVKTFQATSGLVVDGVVGPKTWSALDGAAPLPVLIPQVSIPTVSTSTIGVSRPTLRSGARGTAVSELQTLLNLKNGAGLKVDGIFGSNTLSAVKSFQKSRGLVVDGIVGPKTWAALDAAAIKTLPSSSPAVVIPAIPSTPILNVPNIGESGAETSAIVQVKTLLIAWSKTDGIAEAGLNDYGTRPEDMSTTFGTRDKFVCASFARWNNKTQGTSLNTDGDLTPTVADALRLWAEKRASTALPTSALPTAATPTVSPGVPSVVPSLPTLPALPAVVSKPDGSIVVLPQDTIAATPPAKTGDNTLVLAAGGAGLGYLMAGPVGALIGAAAGAIPAMLGTKSA